MFQLTKEKMENWRSQIVISNKDKMGLRKRPYAFTENDGDIKVIFDAIRQLMAPPEPKKRKMGF